MRGAPSRGDPRRTWPSHIGPKLRANFFFALHTPGGLIGAASSKSRVRDAGRNAHRCARRWVSTTPATERRHTPDRPHGPPVGANRAACSARSSVSSKKPTAPRWNGRQSGCRRAVLPCMLPLRQPSLLLQLGWPQIPLVWDLIHFKPKKNEPTGVQNPTLSGAARPDRAHYPHVHAALFSGGWQLEVHPHEPLGSKRACSHAAYCAHYAALAGTGRR